MVLAGGLLAGWAGAAAVVAVIALLACWSPAREHAYLLSGGLALVGGAFAAQSRAGQLLTYDAWVQVVLTAALAAALPVVSRPNGPMLRRRMKGISIT